ncbi:MAG: MaoC family dehydratase N-terminal domain-containing protein [Gammaproteobacteria bacterium]|nr:MaoC family dehydratase N-terminal domain-containing protein [Gammaproteobacteria bacterium]
MTELLTPELKACIGREAPPRTEVVTRRDIRKYAISTGTRIRKHLDGDEAPPLYHVALFWDVVELDQLTPDGVSVDTLLPKLPLDRAMAGGLEITYHRPIVPGDVLVARRTLTDLYEKAGRSGPLIFYEITLDVRTEDGSPVLEEVTTRILR